MSVQQEKFKEIADVIREKTGITEPIKPSDFASKIEDVYKAGQNAGGGSGGYDEGFADGKEAEKREQWDAKIAGLQKGWVYGFAGRGIHDENFTPFTDIRMTAGFNIIGLFYYSGITDLKGILERYGTSFDLSLGASGMNLFANSFCTHIPKLMLNSCTNLQTAFNSCTNLISIDEIYAPKVGSWTNAFQNCTNLEELRITSEIKINGFDVHWSEKLSKDSLLSILNALEDKSDYTGSTVWVCTLGTINLNKLSDAEKAIATEKGWALA